MIMLISSEKNNWASEWLINKSTRSHNEYEEQPGQEPRAATGANLTPESEAMWSIVHGYAARATCHASTKKAAILSGVIGARPMEEGTLVRKRLGTTNSRNSLSAVHKLLRLMHKPLGFHKLPEMTPKNTHPWETVPFSGENNHYCLWFSKGSLTYPPPTKINK